MTARARERGLFLMEGMWSYTFPAMERALGLVREGAIGRPEAISAQLGFIGSPKPGARLYEPALAGGALLDVGVYGVALANRVMGGPPDEIRAAGVVGSWGVDETTSAILLWEGGGSALLLCSIRTQLSGAAWIGGSGGAIESPAKFSQPDRIVLRRHGNEPEEIAFERVGNGYSFEAIEVMRCIAEGRRESPKVPLDASLAALGVCDEIRAQIGLRYPFE